MPDHTKHCVRDGQEAHAQCNIPPVPTNDNVAGTSNEKGKGNSGAENPPLPSSGDDDKTQVNSDLLNAWMQRLQILTVVTTFLASMDGELFSLTGLNTQIGYTVGKTARELIYACLAGALIFHICAAILGYVASFVLIRYRIIEASDEDETKVGGTLLFSVGTARPAQRLPRRIVCESVRPLNWLATFPQRPERLRLLCPSRRSPRFPPPPSPLALLTRCYYTTLCLTAAGFILAVTGILAYVWSSLRMPVGVFATVCLSVSASAGLWAIAV